MHPGEVLREEFPAPLEMSANALAMRLHVPAPRINDVVREILQHHTGILAQSPNCL